MRWSTARKKAHVKVRPLRLEGIGFALGDGERRGGGERVVALKMKWKGPRGSYAGLVPFRRVAYSSCHRNYTTHKLLRTGCVEWDAEEFESVCDFWVSSSKDIFSDSSLALAPWDVTFQVRCGQEIGDSRTKLVVLGDVSLNIAELASTLGGQVEKRLPVSLRNIDGVHGEATLLIRVSFAEVRASSDLPGRRTSEKLGEEKATIESKDDPCCRDDHCQESSDFSTRRSPDAAESIAADAKGGFSSWKRRLTRFRSSKTKRVQAVNPKIVNGTSLEVSILPVQKYGDSTTSSWEVKEISSRDGKAALKANVFLASFDQRGERAAGESACTALVVVVAHWLHSNRELMPTRAEFDGLITQGSSEWRTLCNHEAYANCFPDNHFDLETVLRADLRPVTTIPDRSYTAIFSPEKFENLKEAMSFDNAWEEISRVDEEYDEGIYIVSWNDHFFVLKVEADACYLIDSLGERLHEGCNQAYIIKFDSSSLMYEDVARDDHGSNGTSGGEEGQKDKEASREIVCKGKDCCREFIKRFFAAIPLSELEEEEKRGTVSTYSLLQRLQIDFHYCSSSSASSSSSSLASSVSSIFSPDINFLS